MAMTKKQVEEQLAKYMTKLEIPREEAEELLKFDNDEVDNEVVAQIEQKVAVVKEKRSSIEKVKNQKAKKKVDGNKQEIAETLVNFIKDSDIFVNPQEISATKTSFMDKDGNFYTISLTKHKTCPDGYKI